MCDRKKLVQREVTVHVARALRFPLKETLKYFAKITYQGDQSIVVNVYRVTFFLDQVYLGIFPKGRKE